MRQGSQRQRREAILAIRRGRNYSSPSLQMSLHTKLQTLSLCPLNASRSYLVQMVESLFLLPWHPHNRLFWSVRYSEMTGSVSRNENAAGVSGNGWPSLRRGYHESAEPHCTRNACPRPQILGCNNLPQVWGLSTCEYRLLLTCTQLRGLSHPRAITNCLLYSPQWTGPVCTYPCMEG